MPRRQYNALAILAFLLQFLLLRLFLVVHPDRLPAAHRHAAASLSPAPAATAPAAVAAMTSIVSPAPAVFIPPIIAHGLPRGKQGTPRQFDQHPQIKGGKSHNKRQERKNEITVGYLRNGHADHGHQSAVPVVAHKHVWRRTMRPSPAPLTTETTTTVSTVSTIAVPARASIFQEILPRFGDRLR